ncbi:MAG TPA: hypothetical protein VK790_10205 [Solirubrobacteraceae bacterium]|nr:hypothetical protein [Solirubrobacteraceae bacterium]
MFRQTRVERISLFVNLAHAKEPHTRAEVPTEVSSGVGNTSGINFSGSPLSFWL